MSGMPDIVKQRLLESLERDANQYRARCGRVLHEQWKDFEVEREALHTHLRGLRTALRVLILEVRECGERGKSPEPWMANEAEAASELIAQSVAKLWTADTRMGLRCLDHPDAGLKVMGRDDWPSCNACGKRVA